MHGPPAPLCALAARAPRLVRWVGALHGSMYVRSGGRLLSRWFGLPVAVLETVGRRSGRRYRTPVCYLADRDDLVVVPANAGSDRVPAWWLNLRAAGEGVAIVGGRRQRVRPIEAGGGERERLWRQYASVWPALDRYGARTRRHLPIVVLRRSGVASANAAARRPPLARALRPARSGV